MSQSYRFEGRCCAIPSVFNYICGMRQMFFLWVCISGALQVHSQVLRDIVPKSIDSVMVVDDRYREDQFYVSLTYNLLGNKPDRVSQQGFSSGIHLGFIRDFPINERRNWAIGAGLGLSSNSHNQNILIDKLSNEEFSYWVIDKDSVSFSKNKFTTYLIEVPLELRWRTSTATEYKFWRIYTGVKFGYVFYSSSKFDGSPGKIRTSNIADLNKLQYGLTLSVGYSTWNAHIYYGLNPLFDKNANVNGQEMDLSSIKIGLMFYIL